MFASGSAFLQFKKQDSLEPCLLVANGDGLHCHGNKLVVSLAVPREQAEEFKGQNTKVKEDKRNLYLAKEGCECVRVCGKTCLTSFLQ